MPFDPHDREYMEEHFDRHGADLGASTPAEYEALADAFISRRPVEPPLHDCFRPNGMRCVYDTQTQEYAIVYTWGLICTYFRPTPGGHLPQHQRPIGWHEFTTNWDYFVARCN